MAFPEEIRSLLAEVNTTAQNYRPSSGAAAHQSTATPRHKLLAAAKTLVTALEDPEEEAWRFALQPAAHVCAISAWQCGILAPWSKKSMSSAELASQCNADQVLVGESSSLLVTFESIVVVVPSRP